MISQPWDNREVTEIGLPLTTVFNSYFNIALNVANLFEDPLPAGFTTFTFKGAPSEAQYRLYWYWIVTDYV